MFDKKKTLDAASVLATFTKGLDTDETKKLLNCGI